MQATLIEQGDGRSVLVVPTTDSVDIYISNGQGAQALGLDAEHAWKLGRVLFFLWVRGLFGLRLWWWRRQHRPKVDA